MRKLLPFETLDSAADILNQICCELHINSHYSARDFLAWALTGDIDLSVDLPKDFQVAKKNLKTFADTPFRPRFPAGTMHCFIHKHTAFLLSRNKPAVLDTVFTISNEGTKDVYQSVKPSMSITLADIGIRDDQLIRRINVLYTSKPCPPNKSEADSGWLPVSETSELPETTSNTENRKIAGTSRIKQRQQEKAILEVLQKKYPDPKKLPEAPKGKAGLPAETWQVLKTNSALFGKKKSIFERAWARLLDQEVIQYDEHAKESRPPPPK